MRTVALLMIMFMSSLAAALAAPAPIEIEAIRVGKVAGDKEPAEFSVVVTMTARADVAAGWKLGFCMTRPLVQMRAMNPRLDARITASAPGSGGATGSSAPMRYLQASSMREPDESAGYTSVFATERPFALVAGRRYTVEILHSNQWSPVNNASAPQGFFVVPLNAGPVPLAVTRERYTFLDLSSTEISAKAKAHLRANVAASHGHSRGLSVVPAPLLSLSAPEGFLLRDRLRVRDTLTGGQTVGHLLAECLEREAGVARVQVEAAGVSEADIVIERPARGQGGHGDGSPEAYFLRIDARGVRIEASTEAGAFYAVQTLRQLVDSRRLPGVELNDAPRFRYRGLLIDTARHFFPVEDLERMIDVMATLKLNTLHLHFADDEGVRLPLGEGYEKVGGRRGYGLPIGPMNLIDAALEPAELNPGRLPTADTVYTGTYSRADIGRLVAYANARHVTVIPEIDMPGHARAMIKSMPDVFVDPHDHSRYVSVQGYTDNVMPIHAYEKNGPFTAEVDRVVREIARLFDGQTTVHRIPNEVSLSGDEVSEHAWTDIEGADAAWLKLPSIQKTHRFFGLVSARHPQVRISGWSQLVQDDAGAFDPFSMPAARAGHVWAWLPAATGAADAARALAAQGYPTVLAFADHTYLDMAYTPAIDEPGANWGTPYGDTCAALRLAHVASTVEAGLPRAARGNVVGLEGALWTEQIPTGTHLMYMTLPKMAGLAEAAWSSTGLTDRDGRPDWLDLAARLGDGHRGLLGFLHRVYGVAYRGAPHGIHLEMP